MLLLFDFLLFYCCGLTVSSGASGSTAVLPATSAPSSKSTTSISLYSQLLKSLDETTRRQFEAAMAWSLLSSSTTSQPLQAWPQVCIPLTLFQAHTLKLICSKHPPLAISLFLICSHPLRSPFPSTASMAQTLTSSLQLPSYYRGFVCSSQLP